MTDNTRCEEHRPINEGDHALEKFLKFHHLQYFGKPDIAQEVRNWIDQMENIFAVLNYEDLRKVQYATFRLLGPAQDWWLRKKEKYETK
jgi:hypothetical protein